MTIVPCPQGCGGYVNTAEDGYCKSCRRDLAATDVIIPESVEVEGREGWHRPLNVDPMTAHKESWCWEWFGPEDHRMRCRLPKGHDGEHYTHERRSAAAIVSTIGKRIR
jgi:hypothetical protein